MGTNQSNTNSCKKTDDRSRPRFRLVNYVEYTPEEVLELQRSHELFDSIQNQQRQQELFVQSEQRLEQLQSSVLRQPMVTIQNQDSTVTMQSTPTSCTNNNLASSAPQRNRSVTSLASSAPQRNRSVTRASGRQNNANNDCECSTCQNTYTSCIYQCPEGHSSCAECRLSCLPCGICGMNITGMRNITLEDFLSDRKVKCRNASDGCRLFLKVSEVDFHAKECPFGDLKCPVHPILKYCNWIGKLSHLSFHLQDMHSDVRQVDTDEEMKLKNVGTDGHSLSLIKIGPLHFLFHVKTCESQRKISMGAQLIGPKLSAEKWSYEVHVYKKVTPSRKYVYSDVCSSFAEPILELFKESKCVSLALPYAKTYVQDSSLFFKVYLRKLPDNKPRNNFHGGNRRGRGGNRNRNSNFPHNNVTNTN